MRVYSSSNFLSDSTCIKLSKDQILAQRSSILFVPNCLNQFTMSEDNHIMSEQFTITKLSMERKWCDFCPMRCTDMPNRGLNPRPTLVREGFNLNLLQVQSPLLTDLQMDK